MAWPQNAYGYRFEQLIPALALRGAQEIGEAILEDWLATSEGFRIRRRRHGRCHLHEKREPSRVVAGGVVGWRRSRAQLFSAEQFGQITILRIETQRLVDGDTVTRFYTEVIEAIAGCAYIVVDMAKTSLRKQCGLGKIHSSPATFSKKRGSGHFL